MKLFTASKTVHINEIDKAKKLVNLATRQIEEIDLSHGRYVVDCKSLLGVLSLDLTKPTLITIHTDDWKRGEVFFNAVSELGIE